MQEESISQTKARESRFYRVVFHTNLNKMGVLNDLIVPLYNPGGSSLYYMQYICIIALQFSELSGKHPMRKLSFLMLAYSQSVSTCALIVKLIVQLVKN